MAGSGGKTLSRDAHRVPLGCEDRSLDYTGSGCVALRVSQRTAVGYASWVCGDTGEARPMRLPPGFRAYHRRTVKNIVIPRKVGTLSDRLSGKKGTKPRLGTFQSNVRHLARSAVEVEPDSPETCLADRARPFPDEPTLAGWVCFRRRTRPLATTWVLFVATSGVPEPNPEFHGSTFTVLTRDPPDKGMVDNQDRLFHREHSPESDKVWLPLKRPAECEGISLMHPISAQVLLQHPTIFQRGRGLGILDGSQVALDRWRPQSMRHCAMRRQGRA